MDKKGIETVFVFIFAFVLLKLQVKMRGQWWLVFVLCVFFRGFAERRFKQEDNIEVGFC